MDRKPSYKYDPSYFSFNAGNYGGADRLPDANDYFNNLSEVDELGDDEMYA